LDAIKEAQGNLEVLLEDIILRDSQTQMHLLYVLKVFFHHFREHSEDEHRQEALYQVHEQ
jgi:hypothetical protein